MRLWPVPKGLYAITPDPPPDRIAAWLDAIAAVLDGGARLLQYRDKSSPTEQRRRIAEQVLPLCVARGVPLIINDDWALARAIGADGVHLGRDDAALAEVRAALGPAVILGATCHDRVEWAEAAVAAGADYVAFGSFHPSPSKPKATPAALSVLARSAHLTVPRVAIGGITLERAPALIAAGADYLAVSSDCFSAADPARRARGYAKLYARSMPTDHAD